MADKQATPDAVVTTRASEHQRSVTVGAFGRSFDTVGEQTNATRAIKAVWCDETGPFFSAHSKSASA